MLLATAGGGETRQVGSNTWPAQESGQMGHCWPTDYGGGDGEVAPVRILPCLSDLTCPRFAE